MMREIGGGRGEREGEGGSRTRRNGGPEIKARAAVQVGGPTGGLQ